MGISANHRGAHRRPEDNPNPAPRESVSKRGRQKAVGTAKVPLPEPKAVKGLLARAAERLAGKKK